MLSRSAILCLLAAACATAGCDRKSDGNGQAPAAAAGVTADEVAPGAAPAPVAAGTIDRSHAGEPAPAFPFQNADGRTVTLAEFRGTPTLVNLWATWCGPCVKELPTLDALAKREGGKLHVVALSQDMDPAKVAPFWANKGLATLKPHTDGKMAWLPAVTANLPTTILYDANGRELWRTAGELDWTGDAAAKALAEAGV